MFYGFELEGSVVAQNGNRVRTRLTGRVIEKRVLNPRLSSLGCHFCALICVQLGRATRWFCYPADAEHYYKQTYSTSHVTPFTQTGGWTRTNCSKTLRINHTTIQPECMCYQKSKFTCFFPLTITVQLTIIRGCKRVFCQKASVSKAMQVSVILLREQLQY